MIRESIERDGKAYFWELRHMKDPSRKWVIGRSELAKTPMGYIIYFWNLNKEIFLGKTKAEAVLKFRISKDEDLFSLPEGSGSCMSFRKLDSFLELLKREKEEEEAEEHCRAKYKSKE